MLLNRNKHNLQRFFACYKSPLSSTFLLPPCYTTATAALLIATVFSAQAKAFNCSKV